MVGKLPDLRQRKDWTCGRTALEIVWDKFGVKSRWVPSTPLDDTSPDVLEAVLWHSGMRVQAGSMDIGDLKYHTSKGRPVICLVTEPSGIGHWIVVSEIGTCKRKGKRLPSVKYQCPVAGPKAESGPEFLARWHDFTRRGVTYPDWGIATWAED